jgi:hypothetical protein
MAPTIDNVQPAHVIAAFGIVVVTVIYFLSQRRKSKVDDIVQAATPSWYSESLTAVDANDIKQGE